tara:strand:- start:385 stop:624 length:240 start_codon:yes stop_codon:yes gene_type:complete
MELEQIINWIMGVDIIYLTTFGFFIAIGVLFLITAIYSLIYDKAFRKKYIGKLSLAFIITVSFLISLIYMLIDMGLLIV